MRVPACLVMASAMLVASGAEARALSCAVPPDPPSRHADVVFDGVLLSGPHEQPLGRLVSTARMHVFRYLKGSGRRVVEIGTNVPALIPGDDPGVHSGTPGLFEPYPGQVYRVYGQVPEHAGSSTLAGVRRPHPCDGTYERPAGTFLRGVKGSRVAERDAGGRRWAAELLRGSGGVRCVRVHPGHDPDRIECDQIRHAAGRHAVAALVPAGGDTWATALAVAHPRLESITVEGSFGRIERRAGRHGVALVVLPGYFERSDVVVSAGYVNGVTWRLPFGGGVLVPDPQRPERSWSFSGAPYYPPFPTACIAFAERPDTTRPGGVFSFPRHGECGDGDYGFFAVRYVNRNASDGESRRHATMVFGHRGMGIGRVIVTGPGGERVLQSARGGIFATTYPPEVDHQELTVTFDHGGSGDETFRGQRDERVLGVPFSRLDTRR